MIELQADYLKQVNPFAMFEVVEPDAKPQTAGQYVVVRYGDDLQVPVTCDVDSLELHFKTHPLLKGDVAFCYWYGTRPGDPTHKERCTILTYGRA